ncbi:MAG: Hsp20/alpha crystallin family protein [Candidatus Nealsonbacteria bacterium]|nr:MAG: Hsp20/alpha crystallin family protein [Candidatus Nealsonbacteria bacterium]
MAKESSFFEKLKKGMGIEGPIEEKTEEIKEKPPRKTEVKKPKKLEIKAEPIEPEVKKDIEEPEIKREEINEEKTSSAKATEGKEKWFEPEGQLAIDVYQTENELIIQSAIAGVKPENLDISMEDDVITIRGRREKSFEDAIHPTAPENYFAQECYWGLFSREVILPVEVDPGRVEATMKEGILTIRIPKILRERKRKINIKRE